MRDRGAARVSLLALRRRHIPRCFRGHGPHDAGGPVGRVGVAPRARRAEFVPIRSLGARRIRDFARALCAGAMAGAARADRSRAAGRSGGRPGVAGAFVARADRPARARRHRAVRRGHAALVPPQRERARDPRAPWRTSGLDRLHDRRRSDLEFRRSARARRPIDRARRLPAALLPLRLVHDACGLRATVRSPRLAARDFRLASPRILHNVRGRLRLRSGALRLGGWRSRSRGADAAAGRRRLRPAQRALRLRLARPDTP